ncbi:hypothetical protein TruAng_000965 [Truncatella angustata]|nr:hypothetical protein TruAng_000965 [Truncatella angustata]
MLQAVQALNVNFRAHVKTHKTSELALLQIGSDMHDVHLAVSTVAEIEHLLPTLCNLKESGRAINILYSVPLPPSQTSRVAQLARRLGPGSITLLIDHPSHLKPLLVFRQEAGFPSGVFLKVDTGYHRAGLPPSLLNKGGLIDEIVRLESEGDVYFVGLYSHSSLSYAGTTASEAMDALGSEINGCLDALNYNQASLPKHHSIMISVGASPQVVAIQNFAGRNAGTSGPTTTLERALEDISNFEIGGCQITLELHAGVYSVMDMQQFSTRSINSLGHVDGEVALSVAAEVVSVYNDGERQKPEALLAVGTLGLGREPCASYKGWAVVGRSQKCHKANGDSRMIVERISQEHCVISWDLADWPKEAQLPRLPLEVGQTLRLYPNHACVTGAMYGHYFVVDSDILEPDIVQDVWVRASGW